MLEAIARRLPAVLREEPQFRRLFASQVLSVFGDRLTAIALPFAVLAVGGGVGEVALVSACQFAPYVLLALPAGVWADRHDRRTLMMWSDAVRLVTQALAAVLLLTDGASVGLLAVLAAVFGAADAFFTPAFSGLLPSTVSAANLQPANALRGMTFSVANVVGPIVAGVVIAFAGGAGTVLLLDAATFGVSLLFLLRLTTAPHPAVEPDEQPTFTTSLREGWTEVRSRPWVLSFLGGMLTYHAVVLPSIFVVGPVLMDSDYDGASSWALIVTLFGIGNILGDVLLLRWKPARAMSAATYFMVGASCQAAVIGSGLPVVAIAGLELVCGICVTAMYTLWETSLGEHVPGEALSRVSSYDHMSSTGVIPLGNLLVGGVCAALGTQHTLWGMTAIGVVVALAISCVPAVRALPRRDPETLPT